MPVKSGARTTQEKAFTAHMARTGDPVYSAAMAGYKHPTPRAYEQLRKPGIQADIVAIQRNVLVGELYPASTAVLAAMLDMNTAGVPWNARATAAKIVRAEVAGLVDPKGQKDFADMTADEIHQAIEDARRQLAERSKPIVEAESASAFE